MKYIITESHNKWKTYILRRLPAFEDALNEFIEDDNPCYYENKYDFADILITESFNECFDYDEDSEEYNEIISILYKMYSERLYELYDESNCDE